MQGMKALKQIITGCILWMACMFYVQFTATKTNQHTQREKMDALDFVVGLVLFYGFFRILKGLKTFVCCFPFSIPLAAVIACLLARLYELV